MPFIFFAILNVVTVNLYATFFECTLAQTVIKFYYVKSTEENSVIKGEVTEVSFPG